MNAVLRWKAVEELQVALDIQTFGWIGWVALDQYSYLIAYNRLKRARHVVLENQRTLKVKQLFRQVILETFCRLMNASHASRTWLWSNQLIDYPRSYCSGLEGVLVLVWQGRTVAVPLPWQRRCWGLKEARQVLRGSRWICSKLLYCWSCRWHCVLDQKK